MSAAGVPNTGAERTGALQDIVILDAATLGAAPWIATYLGEFGAEVIKLEQPRRGDPLRGWGFQRDGVGLAWKSAARNKRSVTVDLHQEEGQQLFRRLIEHVDVLLLNFRPGRMEKWGLPYEELAKINPALIVVHVTAFGLTGPYAQRPGFGTLVEAMSGFAYITGEADGPPTLPAIPLADSVAAMQGTIACLTALHHRGRNGGRGQLIDVSLLEPLSRMLEQAATDYDQLGIIQRRTGNRWNITVPRNAYRTSDDHWVAMSGSSPSIAERGMRAIGRADWLEDPVMASAQGRLARADEIDAAFAEWIGARTLEEVMKTFEEHEVAAAPVYSVDMLIADPQAVARGMFVKIPDDELGEVLVHNTPTHLSETPGMIRHLGPRLGADTEAVLRERLGLDDAELGRLRDAGVI
ncbi:CaiB/BaiF CoA transferase family protein [Mycobacterium palustre]|uniref:CaiB/BaiF CoA transferase family protein n=1 Tax=Mycobacterium palustre TaxID=153971 RepID=UPI001FEBC6B6|nr:CoA transferase [Mycobacterium palustre]